MVTYDGEWIKAVRRLLYALAQGTGTVLPTTGVLSMYFRAIHETANPTASTYSLELVEYAIGTLVKEWVYPSFPKVANIIEHINRARRAPAFVQRVQETRDSHLLGEDQDATRKEKEAIDEVVASWRANLHGLVPRGDDWSELGRLIREARE